MKEILKEAILHHKAGRLNEAESCYREAAKHRPDDEEFYNGWGSVLFELGRYEDAVNALRQAVRINSRRPVTFYRLGIALQATGAHEEALAELCRSIKLSSHIPQAYQAKAVILHKLGRTSEAAAALATLKSQHHNSPEIFLLVGVTYASIGMLAEAESAFRNVINLQPDNIKAIEQLGLCLHKQGNNKESKHLLQGIIALQPDLVSAHNTLALTLSELGETKGATDSLRHVLRIDPGNALAHTRLGDLYRAQHKANKAINSYKKAIERDPAFIRPYARLALLLEQTNRTEELKKVLDKGLMMAPGEPHLNLVKAMADRREGHHEQAASRLKMLITSENPDVRKAMMLPDNKNSDTSETLRIRIENNYIKPSVLYELGLSCDHLGDIRNAFQYFTEANRLKSETSAARRFDKNIFLNEVDSLNALISQENTASWQQKADPMADNAPVFLIGFPRSGTTLLNQILGSHPNIKILEEEPTLSIVQAAIERLPGGYPDGLLAMETDKLKELRALYFYAVQKITAHEPDSVLIDKMPLNIAKAGLIWRLLPNARFILAVRHPCDTCLSCFMQNFSPNPAMQNFYSLEDTVHLYDKVMGNWIKLQKIRDFTCHTSRYEDLVDDFENTVKKTLDFLGVDWSESVLAFNKHTREKEVITTPSYRQVSQPIYHTAKYRWQNYSKYLEPFLPTLQPYIEHFGYAQQSSD